MSAGKPMIEMTRDLFDEMLVAVATKERERVLAVFERDFDQRTTSINFEIKRLCDEVRNG
jgi:hypothetical protein